MQIEIQASNKQLMGLVIALVIVAAVGYVQSYNDANPTIIGHHWSDIGGKPTGLDDGDDECTVSGNTITCSSGALTDTQCDTSGSCSQVCIGTNCQSSWPTSGLKTKVINIGAWNMDATSSVWLSHGLSVSTIRGVHAMIRSDNNYLYLNFDGITSGGVVSGRILITEDDALALVRTEGALFDNGNYVATGSFNRGWIVITYEE